MSIEKVTYKKGNKEETKYRVRIKRKNLSHDEYFDTLKEAEIKNTEILLKLKQGIIPTLTAKEEATIEDMTTTKTEFFSDGAARKIEFSVELKRKDDTDRGILGLLNISDLNVGSLLGGLL